MVASVKIKANGDRCIIKWTGKTGMMSVSSITYCGAEANAASGVEQVPDKAITCGGCKTAVEHEHGCVYDA